MRRVLMLVTISGLLVATGMQHAADSRQNVEQLILALEDQNSDAAMRGDRASSERMLADDYVAINSTGIVADKAYALDLYGSGKAKILAQNVTDRRVRVFGDTAIVTGTWRFKALREGKERTGELRFTRVWTKRQANWQVVSWQGTPISPTPEGGSSKSERDASSESADKAGNAEQEVRQVERELTEALGRGDLGAAERIYADDYTLTTANGEFQNKPQRLAALKLTDPKTTSRNRDDIKVRIYGDTAVVTGRTLFKELLKGVERTEGRRFTHVFVKRQGQWQMVASQVTPVTSGQTTEKKASGEVVKQTVRASDEEQRDRNPESEAEARRVIDAFSGANNRRDVEGLRNALNFPFVRIASGRVSIARTREEFTIQDWPPGAAAEGWHHSAVDSVKFIQSGSDKVHAAVVFSRYKADGTRYATYRTLRIITKQDGHWGIQCSSSFAP